MKKYLYILFVFAFVIDISAQIGITNRPSIEIHPFANLQIENFEDTDNKGILIPSVSSYTNLPLYDPTNSLFFFDESMSGMLMYENTHATFYSYDGKNWINESQQDSNSYKSNKSRFLAKENEEQKVDCVLLVCGRHQGLKFGAPIDGEYSFNNLNIFRETAIIKYGVINYEFENAKFIINESGVYEITLNIPSSTIGVVNLTEGARYQLRAYIKNNDGSFTEQKLTDFTPDYYGVLGIGGDLYSGAYSTTQIRLKEGDYVIARIDSPSATVSVGFTLTAVSNSNIVISNPREILFTKISD